MKTAETSAVKPRRRRRTPEEAREEILSAAERILVEVGPQGLKLADLAAAAGEPHSTLLHHFGSISNVQSALIDRMTGKLLNELTELALRADGSGDIATAGVYRIFEIYSRPENAKLIAWLWLSNHTHSGRGALDQQTLKLSEILRKHLVETGRPERASPENLAGLMTIVKMAAVGEAIGRSILPEAVLSDLPEHQTRDWIADLVIAKLGVRPLK